MILLNLLPAAPKRECSHGGIRGWSNCQLCTRAYQKEWRGRPGQRKKLAAQSKAWKEANRGRVRERARKLQEKDGERINAYHRTWRKNRGAKYRDYIKKRRHEGYDIKDPELVDVLLDHQGGRCAICPRMAPGGTGSWHADHDHRTGLMRGLLCARCNTGLGFFQDSPENLRSAALYLEHTPASELRSRKIA